MVVQVEKCFKQNATKRHKLTKQHKKNSRVVVMQMFLCIVAQSNLELTNKWYEP